MSRTFSHRPWWVHLQDPTVTVEVHDHCDGPCDLPSRRVYLDRFRAGANPWRDNRCHYDVDFSAVPPTCGCAMCTGSDDRRAERRRSRQTMRRELRHGEH